MLNQRDLLNILVMMAPDLVGTTSLGQRVGGARMARKILLSRKSSPNATTDTPSYTLFPIIVAPFAYLLLGQTWQIVLMVIRRRRRLPTAAGGPTSPAIFNGFGTVLSHLLPSYR